MAKKIILFCILFVSLTGCRSIKTTVFSGDAWTTIPDKEIVRNLSSGFAFDLQGLQKYYWELPDSANLITDSRQLLQNKYITKYAKFLFDDLKMTKNDTLLFFIPGELLVYRPKYFQASQANYCFFTPDSVKNEYTRIINDPTGKIQNNDIFRNLIFNKKHKRIICTDTFRDGQNNWLSMAYIREAKNSYNSHISPRIWTSMIIDWSKPQNLLIVADRINHFDKITQKNRLNISLKNKPAFSLFKDFFRTGRCYNYYSAYQGETLSENYFEPQAKSMFLQALATYFSFANDTQQSDSIWLILRNGKVNNKPVETIGTISDLLQYTKNKQVVMFNEAHNAPKHRLLVTNLLDSIYNQGFRYLAIEAFTDDSIFSETGYLTENNGFYLFEPHLSNLIRKAYKKGFKIIGYEDYSKNREQGQAQNIYDQTIKIDKNAKVLVYCGYQHIDTARMAGWFQKISGITPLTIDQTYSYYYSLGKATTDSVALIRPNAEDKYIKNVNLFIFNDLDIRKNTTKIDIPKNIQAVCKIVCAYEKDEFEQLTKLGKIPLPVAVQHVETESFIRLNIEAENYILLFLDKYGNVLKSIEHSS